MKVLTVFILVIAVVLGKKDRKDYGLGYIDNQYFSQEIVARNETTVKNNNTWFIYLFHSYCRSQQCIQLNEAYEDMYLEWQDDIKLRQGDEGQEVQEDIHLGRVNCRIFKKDICDRVIQHQKFPKFVIISGNKSYEFKKGNLTFDYIEKLILTEKYKENAVAFEKNKDMEGITRDNYNQYSIYNIKALEKNRNGTFSENLHESLSDHLGKLRIGIELVAKTYGIRRIVSNDGQIFQAAMLILFSPFLLLFVVVIYEKKYILNKKLPIVSSDKKDN